MKKILLIGVIFGATLSGFSQGYLNFATSKSYVWDSFTTPGTSVVAPGNVNVAFLFSASGTVPWATSGEPTNSTSLISNLSWANVLALTGSGWSWGTNQGNSTLAVIADTGSGVTKGNINYNSSASFQVLGLPTSGNVNVLVVGWSSTYSTYQAAATAGSVLGVSSVFSYAVGASSSSPVSTFSNSGMTAFGVVPVPEPSTLALAALGGASLLLFRRRKA